MHDGYRLANGCGGNDEAGNARPAARTDAAPAVDMKNPPTVSADATNPTRRNALAQNASASRRSRPVNIGKRLFRPSSKFHVKGL
jgi:hypothetical protein